MLEAFILVAFMSADYNRCMNLQKSHGGGGDYQNRKRGEGDPNFGHFVIT